MRILLTNNSLEIRAGSELYIFDVARWLRGQGHTPVAYSARLGPLAETIRQQAIPVIDDLARLAEPPDLIHGHHHLPTMAALTRFPLTPTVYFCHGWLPWVEAPPRHPAIRRYVAVSRATRERLVVEHGVAPALVHTLPNFVDTRRFLPRSPLPSRPRRALVFSNQADEDGWVRTIRAACGERGIDVEIAGLRSGRSLDRPEQVLGTYDLVFARGRAALESMAVGCAVILCDAEGLGSMVTPESFAKLAAGNFGLQVLVDAHRPELFAQAIDAYDAAGAARVSALVREMHALEVVVPRLFAVYQEALVDRAAAPHRIEQASAAVADYIGWLHQELPDQGLARHLPNARTLAEIEARSRELKAELDHAVARLALQEQATAKAERRVTTVQAEYEELARIQAERKAVMASQDAALDEAAKLTARQRDELARLDAEARDLRATLAQIHEGFLFRRVLIPLWKARLRLLPNGSWRHRLFLRARAAADRALGPPTLRRRQRLPADPAEVATDVPDHGALAAVVMDVGGQPETVEAVRSLVEQTPSPEVVVVSSGGGHMDRRLAEAGLDVTVVQVRHRLLPGATRNVGIAATDTPFVAFLEGDCRALRGWVAGRLAAHAAGAEVVSSAVVNHAPWNPFAAAAHCLLFSTRLPGVPQAARLHYGGSYARRLFARFGRFRNDLRTGEDTEFHERIARRVRFTFRRDVRVAHRNPVSLSGLLRDQFQRGRRTVEAREALYPGSARALVARRSLTRVPRLLWTSLAATPIREWGRILWCLPWLVPAALAYSAGAASSPEARADGRRRGNGSRDPGPPAASATAAPSGRTRLLCVIAFRNELRFLVDFLANVSPQVDGIVALDDGSTDGSGEMVAAHPAVLELLRLAPREPHRWNELRNRRLLVDSASRHGAVWVLALDADERLERLFRHRAEELIATAGLEGPQAYAVKLRELWDSPHRYRVDGVWGQKRSARLFRLRADHDFGSRALHGHWAPENSCGPDGAFAVADLLVYHLRMINAADRERRMRRYLALDPDRTWQAIGYEYLVDADGLELEPLPPGREYEPLAQAAAETPDRRPEPVAVVTPLGEQGLDGRFPAGAAQRRE